MVNKITSPITPLEEVAKINEIIDGKQDTLVSGTNIKTINSISILGSGNIEVGGGSANVDNKSITTNTSDQIQTVGVIDSNNTTNAIKTWTGTRQQYDAIVSKDANTLYNITDDTDVTLTILEALYPVGSIYITTAGSCPLSTLISGSTWTQETCRQLVEKKEPTSNDPTWYNLYSDGWCEQGGIATANNTTVINAYKNTVTFLKAFKDTYYTALGIGYSDDDSTYYADGVFEDNTTYLRTAGTITFTHEASTTKFNWKACGYTSTTTLHKQFRRTA